ncbi:DNA polymerase III subunit beta [Candidatus Poriferisocius sp.]|uniref:DNA polymerase III subunit beta n=1 Tax=Candidatus Poriferisocius sp. TaxID=3101276 RepID=UPI003B02ACAC
MKFRCERDALLDALSATGRAAGTRGGFQLVLSGVHMSLSGDELTLTATDRELTITVQLTVAGGGDGEAVVTARLAGEVVRSLDAGAVNVEFDDEGMHIDSARSKFSLQTMGVEDFPQIASLEGDPVVLEAEALLTALRQVVKAASADESRPVLTGVLLSAEQEGLRLVTTDSYRLALCDLPGLEVLGSEQSVLVPSRALQEVIRLLGDIEQVSVRFSEREASFSLGAVTVTTRLIEGEFPSYQGLIPTHQPNRLTVGTEAFINAVRRVRLMAQDSTPIRLDMTSTGLELSATTQDVGEAREQLDATFEGEDLTVAFNPEYLLDGAEAAPGDEIVLNTVDALKPAVIRTPESEGFLYLLMPVRIN